MTDLFTFEELADKAGVSAKTLKRDAAEGKLVTTRIRGRVRIAAPDWEEYLKRCRSAATAKDGKFAFSTGGTALAKLLRLDRTPFKSRGDCAPGSKIVALEERRHTRSKKQSSAG